MNVWGIGSFQLKESDVRALLTPNTTVREYLIMMNNYIEGQVTDAAQVAAIYRVVWYQLGEALGKFRNR